MRWLAGLFGLVLVMFLFHRLTATGPLEARATLALGVLLLAAHLGGDLARRARLPRITGYLLLGFAAGPAWLDLVRADEIAALRFIADAAVALIALTAGSELRLEALRAGRGALARLTAGAIAFPLAAVALVVLSVSPWLPVTVHQPLGDRLAVALVLGTVAAASSPVVTIAQDVAVIVLFALVLAVARALASAGAVKLAVAGSALVQLAAAIAAGLALGATLAEYLRRVRRGMALFLVAVAFVTAEVARLAHLEAMLVALAAGFYLENFSRAEGERLRQTLPRASLPASVVFFA